MCINETEEAFIVYTIPVAVKYTSKLSLKQVKFEVVKLALINKHIEINFFNRLKSRPKMLKPNCQRNMCLNSFQ